MYCKEPVFKRLGKAVEILAEGGGWGNTLIAASIYVTFSRLLVWQTPMKRIKFKFIKISKIGILVLVPLILTALGAYLGLWIGIRFGKEEITIPNLLGKELQEASVSLQSRGLISEIRSYRFSAEYPENHVIGQTPLAGDRIKMGRKVWLVISAGEKEVSVPRLLGLTNKEADIVLHQSGLRTGMTSRAAILASNRDEVVQQFPAAGTTDLTSPFVNYLVNEPKPDEIYIMPDLRGFLEEEITFFLKKEGFVLRPAEFESTFVREPGKILTHYPKAGYPISRKTPITLVVSQ